MLEEPNPKKEADYKDYFSKEENTYLLDFTLPLMEETFLDKETSEMTFGAAKEFCAYIESNYGSDKLLELSKSDESDEEKVRLKNEWLKTIGATATYEPAAGFFFFKTEGNDSAEFPYFIKSETYDLYISLEDLESIDYRELFNPYQLSAKYWETDLKEAREGYFGFDKDVRKVKMYTYFTQGSDAGVSLDADYYDGKIRFFIDFKAAAHCLTHEYTHHLEFVDYPASVLNRRDSIRIMNEGLACENNEFQCKNYAALSLSKDSYPDLPVLWNETEETFNYALFYEMYAYLYQTNEGLSYATVSYEQKRTTSEITQLKDLSYYEIGSLFHYLRETKGIETLREAYRSDEAFSALFDNDYEGTYKKWQKYLEERMQENGITEETISKVFLINQA